MRIVLMVLVVLFVACSAYAWNGTSTDSDGNVSWINMNNGNGTITDSSGNVSWVNVNSSGNGTVTDSKGNVTWLNGN